MSMMSKLCQYLAANPASRFEIRHAVYEGALIFTLVKVEDEVKGACVVMGLAEFHSIRPDLVDRVIDGEVSDLIGKI